MMVQLSHPAPLSKAGYLLGGGARSSGVSGLSTCEACTPGLPVSTDLNSGLVPMLVGAVSIPSAKSNELLFDVSTPSDP